MTTYILTGGNDRASKTFGPRLAGVLRERVEGPVRLLNCWFGTPREDWERVFAKRVSWFKELLGSDTIVELVFPQTFVAQLASADVVCIEGGDDTLLARYLDQIENPAGLFDGKVVIGSSAGADWLASAFWACDWREPRKGSGLAQQNILVHYESEFGANDPRGPIDWKRAEAELQHFAGAGQTLTPLREGEFIVAEDKR